MKKIFSTLAILVTIAIAKNTNAQQDKAIAFNSPDIQKTVLSTESSPKVDAADVNTRALKDFNKSFKNISGEQWYKVTDGFIASFKESQIETKVAYDRKGVFHCVLRILSESQLPADIKAIVKSKYYDFKILVAYEIEHNNGTAYILKIDDGKTLKMLRVVDGEMEIIKDNITG